MNTITSRKQNHLDICTKQQVESTLPSPFEQVHFLHSALPELDEKSIETSIDFLGRTISLPLFISCMTGGSEEGGKINRTLAEAAEESNIPFGLGSLRVLFEHPDRMPDFNIRKIAPSIPILGNLGAVQLKEIPLHRIKELCSALELDALVIHLNCGQELFQENGDTDFNALYSAISHAVETLHLPIIVKETGFGIRPVEIGKLLEIGVSFIDVAGSGGTNWITVETLNNPKNQSAADQFSTWGIPTAYLLDASRKYRDCLIASGGIRSGMDLAKSLALGAKLGGMALPFMRAVREGGKEAVLEKIETIKKVLRSVQLLTGCQNIERLRRAPLVKSLEFKNYSGQIS